MEMNYNDYNTESTDFDYKNYSNEEESSKNNPNQEKQKGNNTVWIILLLLLLLASLGVGVFFFMNNKKLVINEATLTQEKIVLLSKVDSLENEIQVIVNRYKIEFDSNKKEIVILKKRITYFKNLVDYDCKGQLEKAYKQIKIYQQQVEEMQVTIDSLKSIILQLEQNSPTQAACEDRVKFVVDSVLRVITIKGKDSVIRTIDTVTLGRSRNEPTFSISNFKFTGVYHNKKQPDVDLETILTYKMEEYMVSFDLESDKIVAPRFNPTIYVSVISNKDSRTMSATEDQPEVFTLDGQAVEYTISDVADFADKIRYPMQIKWEVLKSNRPRDPKAAEYTIVIYTDKGRLGEFQGILQYGKSPVLW